jgi:NAD(P)H dehydrogenase (quinone)
MNVNATAADQIKSDRTTKTILVTGAAGDTGRPTVKLLLERGHKVMTIEEFINENRSLLS